MTAAEMDAIAGGYHGNAFGVLGPHLTDSPKGKKTWEIRAFLPQAKSVEVLRKDVATPMQRVHPAGVFAAELKHDPGWYQLRLEDYNGNTLTLEDPYRFGPIISEFDLHLHGEGNLHEAWKTLGSHPAEIGGIAGTRFAVWAPNAEYVSVVGDFNDWDRRRHPMRLRNSGIWEIFIPGASVGQTYKYLVRPKFGAGEEQQKADPFALHTEVPPRSGSVIAAPDTYTWQDSAWLERRAAVNCLREPMSTYEVHLGSWRHHADGTPLTYRELAVDLVNYAKQMGYTHLELLPVLEHPFSGSWGYQVIGHFAPTSRFGTPDDFRYFVDACHQAGIGVIVDWVPAHFPRDAHGLARFDGTALYEHSDPRQGEHLEWGTLIFNFGRNEVRQFLVSSALYWLQEFHIDGLRVDAVASMLYLDYAREEGAWIPNRFGGRENLEAIEFLKRFNEVAHTVPGCFTIAEESTSFPGVTRPVYTGGLGFTMKWNMGWMHDMLKYFSADPVYRKHLHNHITFSLLYAFSENFVLPISHDEVVYGKKSLLRKMPGDDWQRFANVRAFLGYMYGHPGKKLLFMGCDIADWDEWNHNASVPFGVTDYPTHRGIQNLVRELNRLNSTEPALHQVDFEYQGFEWIDFSDIESSIISFLRRGSDGDHIVVVCNFTPVPRQHYEIGVPETIYYREILNSDAHEFGGSGMGNMGGVMASCNMRHGRPASISITLPPLAVLMFKPERK